MGKILVTGASGTIGKQVVAELRRRGAEVRAAGHSPEKLEDLRELGAEVLALDLSDADAVREAFEGIDRLFLLTPFVQDFEVQVRIALAAARSAGVGFVLRVSAAGASVDAELGVARQHGRCEELVKQSGMAWTILQPTFFQDNLVTFHADSIAGEGAFYGASCNGETAYVSSADIAACAVAILLDPEAHASKTYALTGPEALADAQVAELVSNALGRNIEYVDLSTQELSAGMRSHGAPGWMVEAIVGLEASKAHGWAGEVSPWVEALTGRPGERYERFLERNRDRLH